MTKVQTITAALLFYLLGILLFRSWQGLPPGAADSGGGAAGGTKPLSLGKHAGPAQQTDAHLDAERVRRLESAARWRAQVEAASSNMLAFRQRAQLVAYPAWRQVIATNQEAYLKLLGEAAKSPKGEVPCTICDGFSYMPCVMCDHHNGKCVTCFGSGHIAREVLCPTCLGSGKCYLCTGSGKMFCPFCNDATIMASRPPPPTFPPLQ